MRLGLSLGGVKAIVIGALQHYLHLRERIKLIEMKLDTMVHRYRHIFNNGPIVVTAHEPRGHFYISPKTLEKYHSVTYFTSFIKDPSLSNWKMNRALQSIQEAYTSTDWNIITAIEKAKLAPEAEFTGAGDIGSLTHAWRQEHFQRWIASREVVLTPEQIDAWPLPENVASEVISGCRAIKRFLKETGAIPIACELSLVDEELKVGGCIDDLMVFPSVGLVFVDLKTSNQGKKVSYAFQVRGFYQRMIRTTFHRIPKKTFILHTSKDDGTYKLIDLTGMKFLEKDAKALVHLSQSWDKVVEEFKPKKLII